jgi:hypothetical protein
VYRSIAALTLAALLALAGCTSTTPSPTPVSLPATSSTAPTLDLTAHQVALPGLPIPGDRIHLSCAAKNFCAAVDETGLTWTWTGTAWTGPTRFAPRGDFEAHITCPSNTFCMASDDQNVYVFDGHRWRGTSHVTWPLGIKTLACAGPKYCVAGPASAKATDLRAWHGTGWTARPDVDLGDNTIALSCAPDGDTCGAGAGDIFTRHGGKWFSPITPDGTLVDLSCTAGPFCMAAEHDHYGVWTGDAWTHRPLDYGIELDGVACSSAKFCLGFDKTSTVVWNWTSWSPGADLPTPTANTEFLDPAGAYAACPVDGWCMATMPGPAMFIYSTQP